MNIWNTLGKFGPTKITLLYVKRSKCKFAVEEIEYLRHVINAKGVIVDSSKVITMLEWLDSRV